MYLYILMVNRANLPRAGHYNFQSVYWGAEPIIWFSLQVYLSQIDGRSTIPGARSNFKPTFPLLSDEYSIVEWEDASSSHAIIIRGEELHVDKVRQETGLANKDDLNILESDRRRLYRAIMEYGNGVSPWFQPISSSSVMREFVRNRGAHVLSVLYSNEPRTDACYHASEEVKAGKERVIKNEVDSTRSVVKENGRMEYGKSRIDIMRWVVVRLCGPLISSSTRGRIK